MLLFKSEGLPVDLIYPILAHLHDRRDLHATSLVSWTFNRAVTPLLYRTLDSRTTTKGGISTVLHPATTLLRKPGLTRYVRHVRESGLVHRRLAHLYPDTFGDSLRALELCTNIVSFSWIDDTYGSEDVFLSFCRILRRLPVQELTIRTSGDLGDDVWRQLKDLTGLRKVAVWSMEGPPRVMQGWAENLTTTLTHLELGRCAGVPATILISVLSQLPLLTELRLRGAPPAAIPTILTYLPNLLTLDTDYLTSGLYRQNHKPLPRLRTLVVRTSSMDADGPHQLWPWILQLVPRGSLESFTLHSFTVQGHTSMPSGFIFPLADIHHNTLREFSVGVTQLRLDDIEYLCFKFPRLESLGCAVASTDAAAIGRAVEKAGRLHTLRLHVLWLPNEKPFLHHNLSVHFGMEHARGMMLRENSQLRTIAIGPVVYKGHWVRKVDNDGGKPLHLEVSCRPDGSET